MILGVVFALFFALLASHVANHIHVICPAGRTSCVQIRSRRICLLLVQKKVTKEKDTPAPQPLIKNMSGALVGSNRRGRCSCLSECYLLASSAAAPAVASDEGTAHVFYERLWRRGVFFFGYFL
ncbi:MAG: hypothetical protein WBN96_09640, partial [Gammaproteobacteria bacterium]